MALRVGIGIITYNRRYIARATVERVLTHSDPDCEIVVADDGSTDGTAEHLRAAGVPLITGRNMGVAWNKNRALFHLIAVRGCDVAILLEDDARPTKDRWEAEWAACAQRYGHVNYAGAWLAHSFLHGSGTAADPIWGISVTAQCSAYSREAIALVGYMDTRFKGYGYEHVEHSFRLARLGYGGEPLDDSGPISFRSVMLKGGVEVTEVPSHGTQAEITRNGALCGEIMVGPVFRQAWRDEAELAQLRAELAAVSPASREPPKSAPRPAEYTSPRTEPGLRRLVIERLYRGADPLAGTPTGLYVRDLQGWNSEHPYLTDTIARLRPGIAIEIGVWKGGSTIAMARAMQRLGLDAVVIAVDTWLGSWDHWLEPAWFQEIALVNGYPALFHKFAANVVGEGLRDQVVPLPLDSANAAELLARLHLSAGVIHIDGGHDHAAVRADLERWWPILQPGGAMILDDYIADGSVWPEVKRAIDEFFTHTPHASFDALHPKALAIKPAR